MTCKEIESYLPALQDDELTPAIAGTVREHLGTCTSCAQELGVLEKTWAALDSWEAIEVAPSFNHRFWKEVEKEPVGAWQKFWRETRSMLNPIRAFAVVLVLVMTVLFTTVNVPQGPDTTSSPPPPHITAAASPAAVEEDVADIVQSSNLGRPWDVIGNPTDVLQAQPDNSGLPKLPMDRIRVLDQDSTSSQKMLDNALQVVDEES